jgi:hypothetical protein
MMLARRRGGAAIESQKWRIKSQQLGGVKASAAS